MAHIRQGDVFFQRIDALPEGYRPHDDPVVARGEAVGHDHRVYGGQVFINDQGELCVEAGEEAVCRHQTQSGAQADHNPAILPPGVYKVNRERDYLPEGFRRAAD